MAWAGMIMDYSFRKLTYASDRFPALAGLETEFGALNKFDRCMIGMWMSELHPQLLWMQSQVANPPISASPPSIPDWSEIPSWSWASVGAGVNWYPANFQMGKENYMCSLETESVTDSNRTLGISGLPLTLHEKDLEGIKFTMKPGRKLPSVDLPQLGLACNYEFDAWYMHRALTLASGHEHAWLRSVMQTTTILPVLWVNDKYDGPNCLVLCRGIASAHGVYHRVGIVRMFPEQTRSQFTGWLETRAKDLTDHDLIRWNIDGTVQIQLV
jgi:hypothetical protein